MIKTKIGGIVLGGLAGYLILVKGSGAMERGIRNICVAQQWKNYYKYGKEGNYVNYVKGANVAGFMKVAKAMLAQGIV